MGFGWLADIGISAELHLITTQLKYEWIRIEQALNYLLFAWQIKIFAIFAMLKKHAQGTKCGIVK